jgi:hypothetical protein
MKNQSGITNYGTDCSHIKTHSVRFVNAAIRAYQERTGPMVEVLVEGRFWELVKPERVRVKNGIQQALIQGEWVNITGVLLQ